MTEHTKERYEITIKRVYKETYNEGEQWKSLHSDSQIEAMRADAKEKSGQNWLSQKEEPKSYGYVPGRKNLLRDKSDEIYSQMLETLDLNKVILVINGLDSSSI